MNGFIIGDIKVYYCPECMVEDFDAVVVVLYLSDKLVMVNNHKRAWEFPGGHKEGDETISETAVREVWEETNVKISDVVYLGYYLLNGDQITVITCANLANENKILDDVNRPDVRIFDSLPSNLSFGDGREKLFIRFVSQMN